MRHRKKGKILSRKRGPRKALLRALAKSFILAGQIKTTEAKAKVLKSTVEHLISIGKKGDLTARRRLIGFLQDQEAAKKILGNIVPQYKERTGGMVKIFKIGPRKGDGAPMAIIKFI